MMDQRRIIGKVRREEEEEQEVRGSKYVRNGRGGGERQLSKLAEDGVEAGVGETTQLGVWMDACVDGTVQVAVVVVVEEGASAQCRTVLALLLRQDRRCTVRSDCDETVQLRNPGFLDVSVACLLCRITMRAMLGGLPNGKNHYKREHTRPFYTTGEKPNSNFGSFPRSWNPSQDSLMHLVSTAVCTPHRPPSPVCIRKPY